MDFHTYILVNFPLWLWGSVFLILISLLQLGLNFLVDRIFQTTYLKIHNNITLCILQVIGSMVAIILGLLVFLVLNNFQNVQAAINSEVSEAGNLYRNLILVNKPKKMKPIQVNVLIYILHDLKKEFQIERYGLSYEPDYQYQGWKTIKNIALQITSSGEIEGEMKSTILTNLNNLMKARRARINHETLFFPNEVYGVLVWSIIIMLFNISLVGCKNNTFRKIYSIMFALSMGLIIVLILEIDKPFVGDISVSSKDYNALVLNINHELSND